MFHHIDGEVVVLNPTRAVLDVGGVGYDLSIPLSTYRAIQGQDRARLLTCHVVREDAQRLYGFYNEAERELFRAVLGINGVGPSIALAVLSCMDVNEFVGVVELGDVDALRKIKGVGRKLAERLIVELRDRLPRLFSTAMGSENVRKAGDVGAVRLLSGSGNAEMEAVRALEELGYARKDAESRVDRALSQLTAGDSRGEGGEAGRACKASVETILTQALRQG